MKKTCVFWAIFAVTLGAGACKYSPKKIKANDLTAGISFTAAKTVQISDDVRDGLSDFGAKLLKTVVKNEDKNKNVLVSPLSAAMCLGMIANGAKGETKTQFENVLGGNVDELNAAFNKIISDGGNETKFANSVWTNKDKVTVEEDFLKTVKQRYNAEVYGAAFNGQTLTDINNWCANKTNGMIPNALEKIEPDDLLFIINALLFEAKWQTEYKKSDITKIQFTNIDGTTKTVEMLNSTEGTYLDFGNADGFLKSYKGGKYSFLGVLPHENVDIYDFAESLDGEKYKNAFKTDRRAIVKAGIPEFSFDYSVQLKDSLSDMGITKVFTGDAEFGNLGKQSDGGKLHIDYVLQKTRIELDRNGTKAAAITIGAGKGESAPIEDIVYIRLDRPFLFGITDTSTKLPLFLGVITKL